MPGISSLKNLVAEESLQDSSISKSKYIMQYLVNISFRKNKDVLKSIRNRRSFEKI